MLNIKKTVYLIGSLLLIISFAQAQDNVYPAPDYTGPLFIKNATIHVGNGQVIQNGSILVNNRKIEKVGPDITMPAGNVKLVDAKGKHVYPGLILPDTDLGLKEIGSGVRGSNDYRELGEWNSNVRSVVAYNTDSRIINTLKANGILLANISPAGSLLSGSSSVVQLDAWNWEDALYNAETGLHLYMPNMLSRQQRRTESNANDATKAALEKIEAVKSFLREGKAYLQQAGSKETNLKFEALRSLFEKKQKLFIHADLVKQLLVAIDFVKEFGLDVVIVGGSESWQIGGLLKENNIAVILNQQHALPTLEDDDIDQPYKTPATLQKAGVLFALNDNFSNTRYRNLAFNAGTAAAYGLTKEEALQAITLNPAKILGINDRTGSIEAGKDANIIISEGDILDMRTSIITHAFIQGREVSLENKQTQLFDRYMHKFELK